MKEESGKFYAHECLESTPGIMDNMLMALELMWFPPTYKDETLYCQA